MSIAVKLSRKLYETFGDEAAETMVDWMQGIDAHRIELREQNDRAFDRLDARLGERLAGFRQELHAEIGLLHSRMDRFETKLDAIKTEIADHGRWIHTIKVFAGGVGAILAWLFINAAWPVLRKVLSIL